MQNILIVDDNERNLFALERELSETGATVLRALSGDEALRLSLDHEFALAILDVQMPGMSGFELIEFLRSDVKTRHLPVIFLSAAFTELKDLHAGYRTGAVDYIVKPFQPMILLSKVAVFLELDRQRKALEAHQRMLVAANRELEAFSYSVSHDLRAPLRTIIGFSRLLKDDFGADLPAEAQGHIERVVKAGREMDALINNLLLLSGISRKELMRESIDLSTLAAEIVQELQNAAPRENVELIIEPELRADADPGLMKIVLKNLLTNAWKYTGPNQQTVIHFGRSDAKGRLAFFVADNGIGFDMGKASAIFDPFVRLHSASRFEGSGIGLSTVQRIIQRHDGEIWAEGAEGQGATFYFDI